MNTSIPLCGLVNHSGLVQLPPLVGLQKLIDKFKGFLHDKIKLLRVAAFEGSGENCSLEKMSLEPDLEENGRC